ncbi:DUF4333 domain-containing protein [Streptomyces sp. NPDC048825]|uniref:DUF4333 domain-containing protein n=1 Tax=Streptomyces sp. NPDC048825 TaxID=3365592 RepID=UPI00371F68DD
MQRSRFLVGTVGGALVAVALGGVGTYLLSGTESNTTLDEYSTVTVDDQNALSPNIVATRTQGKYNPLPWVGKKITDVSCPTGLKAETGATLTCAGKDGDGRTVDIPVTVVRASDSSVTWKFER